MKPNTKIAIAGLLSAASAVLAAFAAEFNGEPAEVTTTTPEAPKTRKPRALKAEEPAATEPEPEEKPTASPEGKTYKDMQDLIRPLVTQSAEMGAEVKKIIAKYSETGLKGMDPKDYPAFEKDIAVLGC